MSAIQQGRASRYRQIVTTLVSYGFSELVTELNPTEFRLIERIRHGRLVDPDAYTRPSRSERRAVRLRLALEELGPTFVKLGQILSTRADLLPPDIVRELSLLQDHVRPAPFERMARVIETELDDELGNLFAHIDSEPLGSASIGQVHAAILPDPDGTPVVVKIQRPGINRVIETDIAILSDLARRAERHLDVARQLDLPELVAEFGWTLRTELDFLAEGRNANRLAGIFARDPNVRVPTVHWSHTSSRVLTLERLSGIPIDDIARLDACGHDRAGIAQRMVSAYFHMILDAGYYHADPHAGNILVLENDAIALLDYGMVGVLDTNLRQRFLPMMLALVERDAARIVEEMTWVGIAGPEQEAEALERDIRRMLGRYYGRPLEEISIAAMIEDVSSMIYRHRLRLPSEIALLMKTAAMAEALARQLDPTLNAAEIAETYLRREIRKLASPMYWARQMKTQPLELLILGSTLPRRLQRLVARLDRQELTFRVHYDELPYTLSTLTKLVNRLATAILVAAGSVGLALLYNAVQPPMWSWRWNIFAVLFLVIGIAAFRLMISIMRSSR